AGGGGAGRGRRRHTAQPLPRLPQPDRGTFAAAFLSHVQPLVSGTTGRIPMETQETPRPISQLHAGCPHCHTTNHIDTDDLANAPDCGSCHASLFTGEPVNLSATEFERHITRSQLPVLVDFWAPWCGPCKMMAPAFEQAAGQLEPRVRVVKVNTDEAQGLGARLNIRSIPTVALFSGGREIARQAGAMSAPGIVRWPQAPWARSRACRVVCWGSLCPPPAYGAMDACVRRLAVNKAAPSSYPSNL